MTSEQFSMRLELLQKYFQHLHHSYDSFSDMPNKIVEIYAHSIDRDLSILQMSILSDIQFEMQHNIVKDSIYDRINLAKRIASDLLNFNMQQNG